MHRVLRICHLGWLCAAMAATCLSACGSGDSSSANPGLLHRKPATVQHSAPKAVDPTAGMGSAVPLMKGPAAVDVKFKLDERPLPGQPLNVDFALVPNSAVVSLSGKFAGDEGLKVTNGDQMDAIEKPAANVPIPHSVTVVPSKDGIYTVTVSLTVTVAGDEPRPRTFAVPIIAGDGLPPLAAHADPVPARH